MSFKHFNLTIKLATVIVASFVMIFPSFCDEIHFAVSPPAGSAWSDCNGTDRKITNVLPSDENAWQADVETDVDGDYSNKVYCGSDNSPVRNYTLEICLSGDLQEWPSGTNRIPASSMKFLYTYAGYAEAPYSAATGNKYYFGGAYKDFPLSYTLIYSRGTSGRELTAENWEHQFKYAVKAPDNQAPGTYKGTIKYRMTKDGGSGTLSFERTTDIYVTVGNYFRLSIDRGAIDFEKMSPGETKDNMPVEGIIITAKTNVGNPWYLKVSNDSPLSSGPYIIPNTNFIWYGWTDGTGRWYGNGDDQLSLVPSLMYSSSFIESNNLPDGTKNHLKLKLTVPKGQAGGKYISNVKFTMTE